MKTENVAMRLIIEMSAIQYRPELIVQRFMIGNAHLPLAMKNSVQMDLPEEYAVLVPTGRNVVQVLLEECVTMSPLREFVKQDPLKEFVKQTPEQEKNFAPLWAAENLVLM
jgi:hypothetical protein